MCGRYTLYTDKESIELENMINQLRNDPRFNEMKTGEIYPTNLVPVLVKGQEQPVPHLYTWGFPSFHGKGVIINARSETIHDKKMFKIAIQERRCIIPSTGFFEWDKEKRKYLYTLPESSLLYMAGIYSNFQGDNRFVILTTDANESVLDVHDRMPVVLPKDALSDWLQDRRAAEAILAGEHPSLIKAAS